MSMLDDLIKARQELKKIKPKTVEIWIMEIMPVNDEKGDPVIVRVNPEMLAASAFKGIFAMGLKPPQINTMTGADEIIMMHPSTFSMLLGIPEFYEMVSGMYPIPVFDDAYRRAMFSPDPPEDGEK